LKRQQLIEMRSFKNISATTRMTQTSMRAHIAKDARLKKAACVAKRMLASLPCLNKKPPDLRDTS
jgi:hypothetical protein